jgi:hypothetical protein
MRNLLEVYVVQVLHPSNRMNPEQWIFMDEQDAKDKIDELYANLRDGARVHQSIQKVIFTKSLLNSSL